MPPLPGDIIEEILQRIPPDEPAHLFLAALVCKPWLRILTDPSFLSRYRAFHRAPPLLGYLYMNPFVSTTELFLPTTAASPFVSTTVASALTRPPHDSWIWMVVDCRHGRVLVEYIYIYVARADHLIVWDPITGDKKKLSVPKNYPPTYYAGAVLCAVDGCDHLDCHAGAFRVVCCGSSQSKIWVTMYSSETMEWSSTISIDVDDNSCLSSTPLIIRKTVYFNLRRTLRMVKYDLRRHKISVISLPGVWGVAMELDDGGLGFVSVLDNCLYKWSWKAGANNAKGKWAQHMDMDLETVLPRGNPNFPHEVLGLVEGTDTIFINVHAGLFTLDLKSRKVKKIGKRKSSWIIPYKSFYTPDHGRFSSLVCGEAC